MGQRWRREYAMSAIWRIAVGMVLHCGGERRVLFTGGGLAVRRVVWGGKTCIHVASSAGIASAAAGKRGMTQRRHCGSSICIGVHGLYPDDPARPWMARRRLLVSLRVRERLPLSRLEGQRDQRHVYRRGDSPVHALAWAVACSAPQVRGIRKPRAGEGAVDPGGIHGHRGDQGVWFGGLAAHLHQPPRPWQRSLRRSCLQEHVGISASVNRDRGGPRVYERGPAEAAYDFEAAVCLDRP